MRLKPNSLGCFGSLVLICTHALFSGLTLELSRGIITSHHQETLRDFETSANHPTRARYGWALLNIQGHMILLARLMAPWHQRRTSLSGRASSKRDPPRALAAGSWQCDNLSRRWPKDLVHRKEPQNLDRGEPLLKPAQTGAVIKHGLCITGISVYLVIDELVMPGDV